MARQPPDDPWDDLLSQLEASLDEIDYPDGEAREAVLAGIREALEGVMGEPEVRGPPHVEVVEGGLDESAPRQAGERPDLRVAEAPRRGGSSVTVLRVPSRPAAPPLDEEGVILLRDIRSQQRIYFGPEHPQTYRLACHRGSFLVVVDGEDPFRLEAGQTADADGAVISVGEAEEGGAEGAYVRLR